MPPLKGGSRPSHLPYGGEMEGGWGRSSLLIFTTHCDGGSKVLGFVGELINGKC